MVKKITISALANALNIVIGMIPALFVIPYIAKNFGNYGVAYPNDYEYTRITEFKHLTGQECQGTSIVREYPQSEGDPYYPVPRPDNEALFKRYRELTEQTEGVTFVGRLAEYRYYNMDQVVGASLITAEKLLKARS